MTAIAKSKVSRVCAGAVITIVRKQRLSRDEQMVNGVDVLSDLTGSKIFLQLVSADVVGKRSRSRSSRIGRSRLAWSRTKCNTRRILTSAVTSASLELS